MTWKTICTARIPLKFSDVCAPSTSARLGRFCLSLARRTPSGEPRPPATTAGSACKTTSPSSEFRRPAVLDCSAKSMVWLEEIIDPRHPETVVRRHRTGFRLYWSWISRSRKAVGRRPISREVRELLFRMVAENPTWERLASTGSCSSWVSKSRNERFLAG